VWADRRWKLGHGRVFALYVVLYCLGRFWIELMRVDPATMIAGVRINVFTAGLLFLAGVVGFLSQRHRPRESLAGRAGGWPAEKKAAAAEPATSKDEVPAEERRDASDGAAKGGPPAAP
jgi:prolipoprotein diacylglyceryltransferase